MQAQSDSIAVRNDSTSRPEMDMVAGRTPGVMGMLLVTRDADVVAVSGASPDALRTLASFAVGLYDIAERLAQESGRGTPSFTVVSADNGHVAVHVVDAEHLLLAMTDRETPIGTVVGDVAWCASKLAS